MDVPLLDDHGNDWWAPLRIELLVQAQSILDLRHHVDQQTHNRSVRVTTYRPRQWKGVGGGVELNRLKSLGWQLTALTTQLRGEVLKSQGLDLDVRRAISMRMHNSPMSRAASLFLTEISAPSMLETVLNVAQDDDLILTADPVAHKVASARGHRVHSVWGLPSNGHPHADSLSRRAVAAIASQDPLLANALAPMIRGNLRVLTRDWSRIRRAVALARPRNVVVPSDQHRYGVLAVWASRAFGARSVVLQHGMTVDPAGYLPLRAEVFAAFGQQSSDWMTARGTEPERIVIVGFPRDSGTSTVRQERVTPHRHVAMVPLQPVDIDLERRIVKYAFHSALARGWLLRLRLHPGDARRLSLNDSGVLIDLGLDGATEGVEIERDRSLALSLGDSYLVIGHDTTVLAEAAGTGPVVAVYTTRDRVSPYRRTGLLEFSEQEGLDEIFDRLDRHGIDPETKAQMLRAENRLIACRGQAAVVRIRRLLSEGSSTSESV